MFEPIESDRQCEDCLDVYRLSEFRFDNKARDHVRVCRCCEVDRATNRVAKRAIKKAKPAPKPKIQPVIPMHPFTAWRGFVTPGQLTPSISARIAA